MTPSGPRRALPLIPFAAVLALTLVSPSAALAAESPDLCAVLLPRVVSHPWTFAWKPNWLPGDPWTEVSANPWVRGDATPAAGLMIAIDPETRRPVTPTPEQRRAMSEAMQRGGALGAPVTPDAPLRVEKIPGGGEITYLDGRFQVYMVARRDANGHVVTDCVPDAESVKRVLSQPAPARAKE